MPSTTSAMSFFGFSPEVDQLMSIDDVPRGLACGCICPSCRLSLIARKGEVTLWHFAHAPDREGKASARCGLTLASSLRAMALQVLGSGGRLFVPAIAGIDSLRSVRSGVLTETHAVSSARTLSLAAVEPGALAINLSDVLRATASPKDLIAQALGEDVAPRRWLYHPNLVRAHRHAHAALMARIRNGIEARYDAHCLTCNTRWSGNGGVRCPECNEFRRKRIACE